jgi:hypothetical protein
MTGTDSSGFFFMVEFAPSLLVLWNLLVQLVRTLLLRFFPTRLGLLLHVCSSLASLHGWGLRRLFAPSRAPAPGCIWWHWGVLPHREFPVTRGLLRLRWTSPETVVAKTPA